MSGHNPWLQYVSESNTGLTRVQEIILAQALEMSAVIQAANPGVSPESAIEAAALLASSTTPPF